MGVEPGDCERITPHVLTFQFTLFIVLNIVSHSKVQVAKENTNEDWDVVEAPVPPPKKAVPPLPHCSSARALAPIKPALPPALKAPAKLTLSAKVTGKAKAKTTTPKAAMTTMIRQALESFGKDIKQTVKSSIDDTIKASPRPPEGRPPPPLAPAPCLAPCDGPKRLEVVIGIPRANQPESFTKQTPAQLKIQVEQALTMLRTQAPGYSFSFPRLPRLGNFPFSNILLFYSLRSHAIVSHTLLFASYIETTAATWRPSFDLLSPALIVGPCSALAAQVLVDAPARLVETSNTSTGVPSPFPPLPTLRRKTLTSPAARYWTHAFHHAAVEDHAYNPEEKKFYVCEQQPCDNRYEAFLTVPNGPYRKPTQENNPLSEKQLAEQSANPAADTLPRLPHLQASQALRS
ncbi:hypothetical protein C8Q80DRAFT_1266257 [Daedaleopsis nitida]|nr:hypothetical protein C8Q80DRAFT_1266257 [Daedaleopsis nitida]